MLPERRAKHEKQLTKYARSLAVRGYRWPGELQPAKKPLRALETVVDLGALTAVAERCHKGGNLAITFISQEYLRVGLNWITAMRRLKLNNFIVIAGDPRTCEILQHFGLEYVEARIQTGASAYVSPAGFSEKGLAMTALKFPVVQVLLTIGYDVVMSDADAVWLRDPMDYILDRADIAFQRIAYFPSSIVRLWGFAACSGFVFFRHCPDTLLFVNDCITEHEGVHSDQLALNLALLEGTPSWSGSPRLGTMAGHQQGVGRREIHAAFASMAKIAICGNLYRYNLRLLALPHHQFWRHHWITSPLSDMVVCHPNSPKGDMGKIDCLDRLGAKFIRGIDDGPISHECL